MEERSAGGVVIRWLEGEAHVLLIRDPYRNWGLPKGHIEGQETAGRTALREVQEETGLTDLSLGAELGVIDWYFSQRGRRIHKFCHFFLMVSQSGETVPEVSEGITECRWLPMTEAIRRVSYGNAREMIRAASRSVATSQPSPSPGPGNGMQAGGHS
ncbi:MAG: NUDIX hydrolase [Gemmatimonadota bacterium]